MAKKKKKVGHPRYRRFKKSPGYVLPGNVRRAIDDRINQMVADGSPDNSVRALLSHLQTEYGKDAIAAYREEIID